MHSDFSYDKNVFEVENQKEAYLVACEWLEQIGIDYKQTRYGSYYQNMSVYENWKDVFEENKTPIKEQNNELMAFVNASAEALDLIRLYESFSTSEHRKFFEKIKK